mmetsp:Transcript_23706/g.36046  ORF Transcript_23706/g.36046 Transcript_23706/m.36046 type:complete len:91 (-) Transcript_23706:226-498(-)
MEDAGTSRKGEKVKVTSSSLPPQANENNPVVEADLDNGRRHGETSSNAHLSNQQQVMEMINQETLRHLEFAWEAQRNLAVLCSKDDERKD